MATQEAGNQGNTTIAVVSAIYMIVLALFTFCTSGLAIVGGSLFGAAEQAASQLNTQGDAEVDAFAQASAQASGLLTIIGIALLVLAIGLLVVAVGIFMRRSWAWIGTIVVNGAYIVLVLINTLTGGLNIVNIVLAVLSGVIIYLFLTHRDTKVALGQPA